jgi:GLPGLI family protein
LALQQGYKFYYTLYVNPKTGQSIYKFDTLVVDKPKGKEGVTLMVNDELAYCVKIKKKEYIKYEKVFGQQFYSKGSIVDIEWEMTNEKKNLFGFECTKAVSKNKDYLITVWFTNKIPVSSGPVNFFGLPGFVVWSEDFFRTTQLEKVEYIEDSKDFSFAKELKKYEQNFDKDKGANLIKESLYLEKKAELVKSMRKMMNQSGE